MLRTASANQRFHCSLLDAGDAPSLPRLPPPHSELPACLSPPPLPHFHWLTAIMYLFHLYHCKGGKKGFPIESWGNNRRSTTLMSPLPSSHAPHASSAIGSVSCRSSYESRTFKMAVSIALIVLVQQEEKGIIKPPWRYCCPQMAFCPPQLIFFLKVLYILGISSWDSPVFED